MFKSIAESPKFQNFITGIILLAGVLVGLETSKTIVASYGDILHVLDKIILGIFVVEIVVKFGAEGSKPWRFFYDPWNVFDFLIVGTAFLPFGGQYLTVLRLLRLLRVLRLVRFIPQLQILVSALLKSIPSMGYVGLFLFLLFYIYAVAGTFLFGHNDPLHFGSLWLSFVSLFQLVLSDGWADLLAVEMYGCSPEEYPQGLCTEPSGTPIGAVIYFISFTLLGTMIILNLFIGVIMNSMEEAQNEREEAEHKARGDAEASVEEELAGLRKQLEETLHHISKIQHKIANKTQPAE
jgi:voltage-gated sodium channel